MEKELVEKSFYEAKEISDSLPEEYRKEVFSVIFSDLISSDRRKRRSASPNKPVSSTTSKNVKQDSGREEILKKILAIELDYSNYHSTLLDGSWADRALVIIHIVETNLGINALTASELAQIMVKQISLPNVHRQNIFRDLSGNKNFLKTKEGRKAVFSLSLLGKNRVKEL